MLYAIRINGNRFIEWCDEHWYGTDKAACRIYTKDEAMNIITNLLPKHYVYKAALIDDNDNEEWISYFKEKPKKHSPIIESILEEDSNSNITFDFSGIM